MLGIDPGRSSRGWIGQAPSYWGSWQVVTLGPAARSSFLAASRIGPGELLRPDRAPELELGDLPTMRPALSSALTSRCSPQESGSACWEKDGEATGSSSSYRRPCPARSGPRSRACRQHCRRVGAFERCLPPGSPSFHSGPRQLLLLMAFWMARATYSVQKGRRRDVHPIRSLDLAERQRLVYAEENAHRLEFRHPLIRSSVVGLSTGDERRRAHLELAELWAHQPDRHAWHLAEATVEPDEHAADLWGRSHTARCDGATAPVPLPP